MHEKEIENRMCPLTVEGWCPQNHIAKHSDFSDVECQEYKKHDKVEIAKCWELYDKLPILRR